MFYRALPGPVFGDPVKNGGSGVRILGNVRFYDVFDVPCQPGVEGGVRGFPWVLRGRSGVLFSGNAVKPGVSEAEGRQSA